MVWGPGGWREGMEDWTEGEGGQGEMTWKRRDEGGAEEGEWIYIYTYRL
jgi:hypothetical protein